MRIDAHHHFWKYNPQEYEWIDSSMRILQRDFLPHDLLAETSTVDIDGVISVQARQTIAETAWLLELAEASDFIKGVVGWVPLTSPDLSAYLERFAASPKFKGVRHVLQDELDDHYMLREDFNAGIRALQQFSLVYDILVFKRQLPQTIEFVDRHPNQLFVLDHIAKPRIRDGLIEPWRTHFRELARRENVLCKISGMVTEANWINWSEEQLQPYLDTVLEAFGPERTMFGSDWPVCLVASTYERWIQILRNGTDRFSDEEQRLFWGENAAGAYQLK